MERAAAAGAASRLPAPTASPPARALAVKPLNIPPMIFTLTPKVSMRHSLVFDEYSQHFQPRYFEHVNNASIPSHAGFRVVFPQQMEKMHQQKMLLYHCHVNYTRMHLRIFLKSENLIKSVRLFEL